MPDTGRWRLGDAVMATATENWGNQEAASSLDYL